MPTRATLLPDVPTTPEAGLPDFEIRSWFGLLVPAGTPVPIIGRLNAETVKVLDVAPQTPEQFGAYIKSEIARFSKIARLRGLRRSRGLLGGVEVNCCR